MSKEAKEIIEKIPGNAGDSMDIIGLVLHDILDKIVGLFLSSRKKRTEE